MASFSDKTVFVTGATAGIGAACARAFAREGARLLVCGRRADRLDALARELHAEHGTEVHAFTLDVRDSGAVLRAVEAIPSGFLPIEVLVNNAGLARGLDVFHEGSLSDWDEMLDTNVKGLLYVSRAVLPAMVARGEGHVIQIGSIAGREVYPKGHVYCASKHAVDAITKGMRIDLCGTGVRVSTVDPGLVDTEFARVRFHGDEERAEGVYEGMTPLTGDDVAETVLWVANRPAHVNVAEVLLLPADQASAGHVHRRR